MAFETNGLGLAQLLELASRQSELDSLMKANIARAVKRAYEDEKMGFTGRGSALQLRQQVFAARYVVHFNAARAVDELGRGNTISQNRRLSNVYMRSEYVQGLIVKAIQEQNEKSTLDAEYVREYIKSVLEFSPIEFFDVAPEGGWCITPEKYSKLPAEVRRLIEDVEYRTIRGDTFLAIRFISKTAALAMAARYTLTQKMQLEQPTVPWKELVEAEKQGGDAVEAKLAQMEAPAA